MNPILQFGYLIMLAVGAVLVGYLTGGRLRGLLRLRLRWLLLVYLAVAVQILEFYVPAVHDAALHGLGRLFHRGDLRTGHRLAVDQLPRRHTRATRRLRTHRRRAGSERDLHPGQWPDAVLAPRRTRRQPTGATAHRELPCEERRRRSAHEAPFLGRHHPGAWTRQGLQHRRPRNCCRHSRTRRHWYATLSVPTAAHANKRRGQGEPLVCTQDIEHGARPPPPSLPR